MPRLRHALSMSLATAVEIRPASAADAPLLGRFGARLALLHHRMDSRRFFATPGMEHGYAEWLTREMRSRKAVVLAAVSRARREARVVGYAYGRLEGRDWNTLRDPAGVGVDLYVVPAARGRGVAKALLERLVSELGARGAPRVILHVAARNARALALFERMGFRRTVVELARELDQRPGGAGRRSRR